ncbi:YitT family protein [Mycoplasmopsis glycophila]|uniref:Uncharacterized protein conserved in bacteria (DUF2179) n=1 Tax=Mycoplasmopsis glycophila TaxID=171285 RepID=A0A449AVY2_9BACT|nr:DUF2179 domain-containing protein [Mycoplasmopsis glycophila]VEU70758.1 Uncharacterized protein conserved in bacteria (DUF2179) [Mycoplasmopsis glycophila]
MFNFWNKNNKKTFKEDIEEALIELDVTNRITKKHTIYKRTKMSNFGLKLSSLYSYMPIWKITLITVITAIFFGVISVFFVKNVGIYNFGLAAFGQAAARILITLLKEGTVTETVRNLIDQFVFWILYIILSIPIFIFGYKRIGKLFTNLTVLFLAVSSLVSFSIGLIPGANQAYLIGNFQNSQIKDVLPGFKKALSGVIPLLWNDGGNIIALMIYAIVYGYLLAWIFAIIQIIGGTAGVTGVIGEWYANEKQKSFGSISGYMNIIIVFISVAVGSWLPGSLLLQEAYKTNLSEMKNLVENSNVADQIHSFKFENLLSLDKSTVESAKNNLQTIISKIEPESEAGFVISNWLVYRLSEINDSSAVIKISSIMENLNKAEEFNIVLKQYKTIKEITDNAWKFSLYLSPNFIATILTNVVYILTLNKLYPKFKLVRVEIFSEKWNEIRDSINADSKIVTGITIFKARGGFKGNEVNVVTSISLFRHVVRILKAVHKIDPEAFVSISDVSSIDGYVYLPENKF